MTHRMIITGRWFAGTLASLILLDVASLAAYTFPIVNWLLLPVVVAGCAYLALRDLRWSLVLPLAELAWGSFGLELFWDIGGVRLSLRIALLAVFAVVWLYRVLGQRISWKLPSGIMIPTLIFTGVIIWGFAVALARGVPIRDAFMDGNAYLFIAYLPIWARVFSLDDMPRYFSVLMAAATGLAIKTLALFNIFINYYDALNVPYLYLWLRDTRIGELTHATSTVWRIFMQSQLYIGIALLWYLVRLFREQSFSSPSRRVVLLSLLFAAFAVSLSRSYWLGFVTTSAVLTAISLPILARASRRWFSAVGTVFASIMLAALLIFVCSTSFTQGGRLADAFFSRVTETGDLAGVSRLHLLPPLAAAVAEHPFIGSGFGRSVTFNSSDPRIRNFANPTGEVTTFAFEWGYLDQALELGLIALALFVAVIIYQFYLAGRLFRASRERTLLLALAAGLFFVAMVHAVSPYLNHPLGIGYLILTVVILQAIASSRQHNHV